VTTPSLFGVEDLVVGLLVDAVGDLLVVLVSHAMVVGELVDLCRRKLALLHYGVWISEV
jgi:hypothetical protein